MAIGVYFHQSGLTGEKYAEALKKLEAAGAGAPKGRSYHVAFGPAEDLMVFDVWNSAEEFEAFGKTLLPILGELGIEMGQPDIAPVQNTIQG